MKNSEQWKTFYEKYNDAHLLQSAEWGDLKSKFGWDAEVVITENAGGLVLFRKLPLGFHIAYIPEGPLGNPDEGFWNAVDDLCRERKAVFLKVEPFVWEEDSDSWSMPEGFKSVKDTIQPPRTILVDLREDEEVILAKMKQKTRYNVRLATKKGVEVTTSEELNVFHQLMKVTGERDAFGVHNEAYYQAAFEGFHAVGKCELLIASFEDEPLAAVMMFTHGKNAWYLYGASSNVHRNKMPTYLLQWEAMKRAKALGCESYDLFGVPDESLEFLEENFMKQHEGLWGVYRFKRGWGGELKRTVGAFDKVYRPLLYKGYELMRRMR